MTRRVYIPGSEWLYIKLYTGAASADRLLVKWLCPLYEKLLQNDIVSKMFYIRYYDSGYHLRIRFLLNDTNKYQQLIKEMSSSLQSLVDANIIWKIEVGTYEREIERYGKENIEILEAVFACDSYYIMNSLEIIPVSDRWKLSCLYIEQLFDVLQFSPEKRFETLNEMQLSFRNEMGLLDSKSAQTLNKKYRTLRPIIDSILAHKNKDSHYLALSDILIPKNVEKVENNVSDIIHLLNNRIFVSFHRQNEAVLYYLLYKKYQSIIIRANENHK